MLLSTYFEARQNDMICQLTEEQKKIVKVYEKDDAGCDLISFFEDDLNIDEELIEELQRTIEFKNKVRYLESRDEKLNKVEELLEIIING